MVNKGCPLVLGGPLPHVMAAKAVAFKEANQVDFQKYAHKIVENAKALAEGFIKNGMRIVTGGTDNHLMVVDLSSLPITGRQAELILREAKITINRNAIPFDEKGAWYTSGIRLGTAALTTLGMGKEEMAEIAAIICSVLKETKPSLNKKNGQLSKAAATVDPKVLQHAQKKVEELLHRFPLYPEIELDANLI